MTEHTLHMIASVDVSADIQAEDGGPKSRTFSISPAYSGGRIRQPWSDLDIVTDLAGMTLDAPAGELQALVGHEFGQWAGVIKVNDVRNTGTDLHAAGEFFELGDEAADMVIRKAKKATWQASIGASIQRLEQIEEGASADVNGQTFDGPVLIARETSLYEISFVPRGADNSTSAAVYAVRTKPEGKANMADPQKPDALAAKRTRDTQIKAEFGSDTEFALEAVLGDETIEALRLTFAQKQATLQAEANATLQAELATAQAELAAAKAAPAPAPALNAANLGGGIAPAAGSAKQRLEALVHSEVERMQARGVLPIRRVVATSDYTTFRAMALASVLRDNPEAEALRLQWLADVNG